MNKEQLLNKFDEKFYSINWSEFEIKSEEQCNEIKQFIFDEMIPEVLKSVMEIKDYYGIEVLVLYDFKQKAKELYKIDL